MFAHVGGSASTSVGRYEFTILAKWTGGIVVG